MRLASVLTLFLLCSAPAVRAQEAASAGDSLRYTETAQHMLMVIGGHFGGGFTAVGAVVLTTWTSSSSEAAFLAALMTYPLGVAAASYGLGRALGRPGTFGGTLRGAYLGASLGAALGASAVLFLAERTDTLEAALGVLVLSGMLYIGGTLAGAVHGYDASIQPTALRGAGGEAVPGLRVAFSF